MMNREKFELIATTFANDAEIVEFTQKEIAKIDQKAEAKKAASAENQALADQIVELLAGEKKRAAEVAKALDISTQKASYLLRMLFGEGAITREPDGRCYVYSA